MDKLTVKNLYDFDHTIAKDLFESITYPWEALPLIKDYILKRLSELGKPFAILLPLPTLQGQKRFEYLKDTQALVFDKRINFYTDIEHKNMAKGVAFASIYICKDFLPNDLIFEKL